MTQAQKPASRLGAVECYAILLVPALHYIVFLEEVVETERQRLRRNFSVTRRGTLYARPVSDKRCAHGGRSASMLLDSIETRVRTVVGCSASNPTSPRRDMPVYFEIPTM